MLRHNVIVTKNDGFRQPIFEFETKKHPRPDLRLASTGGPTDGISNWLISADQWHQEEAAKICDYRGIENPEDQPDYFHECMHIGEAHFGD